VIHFRPVDADPFILKGFPYDEYEIEPCPLTAYLLAYNPAICWQVSLSLGLAGCRFHTLPPSLPRFFSEYLISFTGLRNE